MTFRMTSILIGRRRPRLVGKIGAKEIEGGRDLRTNKRLLQDGAKRPRPVGIATKRFRKRAQQARVGFVGLHFDADESLGGRPPAVRGQGSFLRWIRHDHSDSRHRSVMSSEIFPSQ
jgi:hypothetical protein